VMRRAAHTYIPSAGAEVESDFLGGERGRFNSSLAFFER